MEETGRGTDMGNKIRRNKSFFMLLILGIVCCGVCMVGAGMTVRAEEQTFIIDAQLLPSNRSAYEIQVKVENQGADWEGTVRLRLMEGYYGSYGSLNACAYDTELSLPQGSTKQFVVRVPKDSLERTDGVVQITLLDKHADIAAQKEFVRLLQAEADFLIMGILSDTYSSLSYLDMGGEEFYYRGKGSPIKLEELDQDNLADALETLDYLVIDNYNTGVLPEQTVEKIGQWIDNGGTLILGTGSVAEEALAGLDDLEIECARVYEPGAGPNIFTDLVDVSQLSVAELRDLNGKYEEGYIVFGLIRSLGNGAVEILPYSLAEVAQRNAAGDYEQQKSFVEGILLQVSDYASAYGSSQYTYSYDNPYLLSGLIEYLGNGNSRLRLGGLKALVILYVIFVGPILYLILRFAKKRDLYWIAVPVTTLVGIFLVYFAGRGFEVVSTNVYSVTVEDLSDKGNARTYLRCYDAGHNEWKLRLAEGYEYAGPLENDYYRRDDVADYYYHIRKEGDRLFFGMDPSMGFEDGYFQAGIVREPEEGSIYGDLRLNGQLKFCGTITNETRRDFKYFAVSMGADLFVYKDLPAGATVDLDEAEEVYSNEGVNYGYYDGLEGYYYSFLRDVRDGELEKDADVLTALGMGIASAYNTEGPDMPMVIGVTENWDKAVDDHCNEVSYGCLYVVQ